MNAYKVNYLSSVNRIEKILVFSGLISSTQDLKTLFQQDPDNSIFKNIFTQEELEYVKSSKIEVDFSKQTLHKDDAVGTIKSKVMHQLEDTCSIEEMFMFFVREYTVNTKLIFNVLTRNGKMTLTRKKLDYFFMNIVKDVQGNRIKIVFPEKDAYTFKDLLNLGLEGKKVWINCPLGKRHVIQDKQYPFICNPFEFTQEDQFMNKLIVENIHTLNNNLLLSGGNVINNNIYLCLAKDILTYRDLPSIIQTYFPLLYTKDINNIDMLDDARPKLITESKKKFTPSVFEGVDLLYTIHKDSENKLEYLSRGIRSIQFVIRQMYSLKVPTDVMFKIYHASKDTPFVKYNPGEGQEKLIRLYANKKNANGTKVPYLSRSKIKNFVKNVTPKAHSISIYFEDLNAECSLSEQGDIQVSISFPSAVTIQELDKLLFEKLNPKLELFKEYLGQHGYTIGIFNGLEHSTTDVKDINYNTTVYINRQFSLKELGGCVSNIFISDGDNLKEGIKGRYKRVANFNAMTSMEAFIVEKQKIGMDYQDIIEQLLIVYPDVNKEEAIEIVGKLASELQIDRGVRKNVIDLKMNPGFSTIFSFDAITSELRIDIKGVDDIQYLSIIPIYLDSIVQMTQFKSKLGIPPNKIKSICGKDVEEDIVFEEIIANTEKSYNEKLEQEKTSPQEEIIIEKEEGNYEKEDDVSDYSEDALDLFFGEDEESEEESEENNSSQTISGGQGTEVESSEENENEVKDIEGLKLNNPYYFQKRMQERDPSLIMTEKKGKFKEYSRVCHEHVRRQPVILTQRELDKINEKHPGFLKEESDIVKYGSNPDKQYYYICPRYWDLKKNTLITPAEIKEKKLEDKIIPLRAKTVPKGKYIYEFTNPSDGSNTPYPSLIPDKHPQGHCLPCCFKNWKADSQIERKKRLCQGKEVKATVRAEKDDYILGPGKFPLNQDKWGYLPTNIQHILKSRNTICVVGKPCVLRHGVEYSKNQSFLACISDALFYVKNKGNVPTIEEVKQKIVSMLTLDNFITFQNGNLITEFYDATKKVSVNAPKYRETRLYARTKNDSAKLEFFNKVCNSFEQYVKFVLSQDADIDYTYLWDLVSTPNPALFENGINLVIFKSPNEDNTDNLNLICPTNHYTSRSYDPNKPTLLLYNEGQYFEPIYTVIRIFDESNREIKGIIQLFKESDANLSPEIKYIFELIIKPFYDKMCRPMASMPRVYKAKQPILLEKLIEICLQQKYKIKKQMVNLQGKVIGLFVELTSSKSSGVIPCFPSSINSDYEYDFVVEDYFWQNYKNTITFLQRVKKDSQGLIPCEPVFKVIDDEVVVGILTETNQFIQLSTPEPVSNISDNLKDMRNSNYVVNKDSTMLKSSDNVITEENGIDEEREDFVKKIRLETRFYEAFRNTVKVIINETKNSTQRETIEETVLNLGMMYSEKIKLVYQQLKQLVGNMTLFVKDYNYKLITNIHTCITKTDENKCKADSPLCSVTTNGKCQIILPKTNLLNGLDNEHNYFLRMADELIRYKRIQQFMFRPQVYLSFGNVDYNINDDEIVILQSMLTDEFFEGAVEKSSNSFIKSNTYDTALPGKTEKYGDEAIV